MKKISIVAYIIRAKDCQVCRKTIKCKIIPMHTLDASCKANLQAGSENYSTSAVR